MSGTTAAAMSAEIIQIEESSYEHGERTLDDVGVTATSTIVSNQRGPSGLYRQPTVRSALHDLNALQQANVIKKLSALSIGWEYTVTKIERKDTRYGEKTVITLDGVGRVFLPERFNDVFGVMINDRILLEKYMADGPTMCYMGKRNIDGLTKSIHVIKWDVKKKKEQDQ